MSCQDSVQDSEIAKACQDSAKNSKMAMACQDSVIENECLNFDQDLDVAMACQQAPSTSEMATPCPDSVQNTESTSVSQYCIQDSETNHDSEMVVVNSNQHLNVATVSNNSISNSNSANEDDNIFIKPQSSYVIVKQKKLQHTLIDNNTNSQATTNTLDVYTNPIPSSSKAFEEIPSSSSGTVYVKTLANTDDKTVPIRDEGSLHSNSCTPKQDFNSQDVICLKQRVELFAQDTGPQMYLVKGNLVTRPIVTKNLPDIFQYLPVCGKPGPDMNLQQFYRNKVREYVGCDLNDEDFNDLENYCNPELLKSGLELQMQTTVPTMGVLNTSHVLHNNFSKPESQGEPPSLVTLKKNKIRNNLDEKGLNTKKLKYRGVRMLPFSQEAKSRDNRDMETKDSSREEMDVELKPGEDILYRVRVYRPFTYLANKDRYTRTRHSVFSCDIVLSGRHKLTALRDRFVCHNDFDLRVDVSDHPDNVSITKAKDVFPSGFLFINNVFYVDTRKGCKDYSAPIREWASKRKMGDFPKKDMCQVRLQDLVLKLGYPEVYVHQGNCEHLFVFSEVRLLSPTDPQRFSNYPCSTAIGQNQTVYCTTCAEFSAKWIVVGSDRVPFDPGFFCDTCFKQYMYIDGKKIGNFKAYRYRGNALNVLKP